MKERALRGMGRRCQIDEAICKASGGATLSQPEDQQTLLGSHGTRVAAFSLQLNFRKRTVAIDYSDETIPVTVFER